MDPDESKNENKNQPVTSNPNPASKTFEEEDGKNSENPLKIEWSLFWEGLLGDGEQPTEADPLKAMTKEQISKLIKDLSAERKQLHKQIESVNKEIELNSAKLESLRLVGSESDETLNRLNFLSDKGQDLDSKLTSLNQKLKLVRNREKEISAPKEWA